MTNPAGSFIWYELMTPDPDAAAAFYGAVIGWTIAPHSDPASGGMDYRMIVRDDGGMAGGVLKLSDDMLSGGAKPAWLPYLHAPDVDAMVGAIVAEGGTLRMPPTDLPVGRIALVSDPQGVPIYLMNPTPPADRPEAISDVFHEDAVQRVRWNELVSPDLDASLTFYRAHFGFEYPDKMPMGEMGDYWFINHHGRSLGAIMQRGNQEQPPMWGLYFGVPSAVAAKTAIEANGGTVLFGPEEVPGGDWVIVALDPQGVSFGVVGPKGA